MTLHIISVSFRVKDGPSRTIQYKDHTYTSKESIRSWYKLPSSAVVTLNTPGEFHITLQEKPHKWCYGECTFTFCTYIHLPPQPKSTTPNTPPKSTTLSSSSKPPTPKHTLDDSDSRKNATFKATKLSPSRTPGCDLYTVSELIMPLKAGVSKVCSFVSNL